MSELTPVQEQVLTAIVGGATITAAAEAANVHRNTIGYWRRTSLAFRRALGHAQYDRAILIRETAEQFVDEAFAALHAILSDPKTPAAARLNAAKFIIQNATTPPLPDPEWSYRMEHLSRSFPDAQNAQTAQTSEPEHVDSMHKDAQSAKPQPICTGPKTGRNEPCPCGSGLKFKRCCLNKPRTASAAA